MRWRRGGGGCSVALTSATATARNRAVWWYDTVGRQTSDGVCAMRYSALVGGRHIPSAMLPHSFTACHAASAFLVKHLPLLFCCSRLPTPPPSCLSYLPVPQLVGERPPPLTPLGIGLGSCAHAARPVTTGGRVHVDGSFLHVRGGPYTTPLPHSHAHTHTTPHTPHTHHPTCHTYRFPTHHTTLPHPTPTTHTQD